MRPVAKHDQAVAVRNGLPPDTDGSGGPSPEKRRTAPSVSGIDGATGARIGLASHVVTGDMIDATLGAMITRLPRHSSATLARIRRVYKTAAAAELASGMESEQAMLIHPQARDRAVSEGLDASSERRPLVFSRFRPVRAGTAQVRVDGAEPAPPGTAI